MRHHDILIKCYAEKFSEGTLFYLCHIFYVTLLYVGCVNKSNLWRVHHSNVTLNSSHVAIMDKYLIPFLAL